MGLAWRDVSKSVNFCLQWFSTSRTSSLVLIGWIRAGVCLSNLRLINGQDRACMFPSSAKYFSVYHLFHGIWVLYLKSLSRS